MGLCNIFNGSNGALTTALVIVLLFSCGGFGNGILDCLCNLDTCSVICIILFILHCCGFFDSDSGCGCPSNAGNNCGCGCGCN